MPSDSNGTGAREDEHAAAAEPHVVEARAAELTACHGT